MRPSSAKAKGRRLQNQIRELILENFPQLHPDDVKTAIMGESGEDIKLSPAARNLFPYSVEAKNVEKLNIWSALDQATENTKEDTHPLLFFKRNHSKLYVAFEASHLFELLDKCGEWYYIPYMDNILFSLEDILGTSKKTSSDERLFHCPFCYHHKPKLSINFGKRSGYWKCWVCDEGGKKISSLLYKLGYSKKEIKSILGEYETGYKPEENPEEYKVNITLPKEYKPLWKVTDKSYEYMNAIRFLKSRGVNIEDIYRYQIGYCEDGQYKNRIIIPSYGKDFKLNYFVSRSYYDGGIKYKNPAASRNNIIFENLISWKFPVVLVEGIFDAITVRRNCIPLLGKILSDKLKQTLIENKPPMVYVMLDSDAQKEALQIESYLKSVNVNVKLVVPTDKDPSEMGFDKSWVGINNAIHSNFTDLVGTKLQMV